MLSLEAYTKCADELALEVINLWNASKTADFTPDFTWLLNKTIHYLTVKHIAAQRRAVDNLRKSDETDEQQAKVKFVLAYKIFRDRRAAKSN